MSQENPLKGVVIGVRAFYDGQLRSLNGMLEKLPEALRPEFEQLRSNINNQLAQLPPLDQIPAALDISYAVNSLNGLIDRISGYASELTNRMNAYGPKLVSLNSFETRLAAKELLSAGDVKEMVDAARKDERGKVEGEYAPKLLANRKKTVELAGLPMPADELLSGAEFDALFSAAEKNVKAAKARNFDVKIKLIERAIWLPETDFAKELDTFAEFVKPGTVAKKGLDPLKGGNGGGDGGTEKTQTKRRAVLC